MMKKKKKTIETTTKSAPKKGKKAYRNPVLKKHGVLSIVEGD